MSTPIFWSAVNLSEGQRSAELQQLAQRLESESVHLADWSADPDHHRAVFSLVGDERSLLRGLHVIFDWAEQQIDLRQHQGQHPRLGAVDVVPFAPLKDADLNLARQVSERCAQAIASRYGLPVFLYRESSRSTEEPLTLPWLRRGGLDGLSERLRCGELRPDLGPSTPHPRLGVTVFGARPPLIAFNCLLDTGDLELGRAIAARVRERGGGPPGVQALAFPLSQRGGAVQISMNLTQPERSPPHVAYLRVREVAASLGAGVVSSELVGLVPEHALRSAFQYFLQLDDLKPCQVVENNFPEREPPECNEPS